MKRKKKSRAVEHLQTVDPVLGAVIMKIKLPREKPRTNCFQSLAEEIVSQQLSGRVADVITQRFVGLFNSTTFPEPADVLSRSDEELRKSGLSYQKISYVKNVARAVSMGELDFKKFST